MDALELSIALRYSAPGVDPFYGSALTYSVKVTKERLRGLYRECYEVLIQTLSPLDVSPTYVFDPTDGALLVVIPIALEEPGPLTTHPNSRVPKNITRVMNRVLKELHENLYPLTRFE